MRGCRGVIYVRSRVGEGSLFVVRLPLAQDFSGMAAGDGDDVSNDASSAVGGAGEGENYRTRTLDCQDIHNLEEPIGAGAATNTLVDSTREHVRGLREVLHGGGRAAAAPTGALTWGQARVARDA